MVEKIENKKNINLARQSEKYEVVFCFAVLDCTLRLKFRAVFGSLSRSNVNRELLQVELVWLPAMSWDFCRLHEFQVVS